MIGPARLGISAGTSKGRSIGPKRPRGGRVLHSHLPMSYDRLLHRDFSLSKVNGDTNFQPERDKSETLNTLVHPSTHTQSAKNSAQLTTNTAGGGGWN